METSVNRLPQSPLLNREAGYALAELAATGDEAALQNATDRFQAAVNQDPNFALHWLNLGALLKEAGRLDEARTAMETAAARAYRWGLAWLNLGEVCELQADEVCARQAYLKALELAPEWTQDPYWNETTLRQGAVTAAKAIHPGNANPQAPTTSEAIRQSYSTPVLAAAKARLAEGMLDEAERLLKTAPLLFTNRENDLVTLHWLEAELAAARGDTEKAAILGQAARDEFIENRLNDAVVDGINLYGAGIYQLPTLGIDLVPQVTWMQYPGDWQERLQKLGGWQE